MLSLEDLEKNPAQAAKDFDLFNVPESYFETPHIWHKALRDHDPMHKNSDGSILLTRYDDVKVVWNDRTGLVDKTEQFRGKFGEGDLFEHHTNSMLFRDPPSHDRLRELVTPFFSQSSVKRLSEYIEGLVDETIEKVDPINEINFARDFSFQIPISVICRILGVPREDGPYIHEVGAKILYPLNPKVTPEDIQRGNEASKEFKAYLMPHVERIRAQDHIDPEESILCAMLAAEREGAVISEPEILHMCILMLNGGHETTTNLMSVSMHYLLNDPEQMAWLQENPDKITTAIEELVRLVSPLQLQGRRTTRDVEIPSGVIPEGTEVVLCQSSANRDERMFEDPNKMNLERMPNLHVGFGAGIHACIGRPLARLEASIALPKVLAQWPNIKRNGPHEFARNTRFRGMPRLDVKLK